MKTVRITVEFETNPTVELTDAGWRRLLAARVAERVAGLQGQQEGLSVTAVSFESKDKRNRWSYKSDF